MEEAKSHLPTGLDDAKPLSSRVVLFVAAIVLASAAVAFGLLVWPLQLVNPPATGGALESLKTALAIAAGVGAAATLALAARRQVHQERTALAVEHDATERRNNEVYNKSVEQLGSTSSSVRIGALFALERLGRASETHRQIVVDVMCAYLRKPYSPNLDLTSEGDAGTSDAAFEYYARGLIEASCDADVVEEMHVRLTAQDILHRVCTSSPTHGPAWNVCLKLSGATLIDFRFDRATLLEADFVRCTFLGELSMDSCTFVGPATFDLSYSDSEMLLGGSTFRSDASFNELRGDPIFGLAGATLEKSLSTRFSKLSAFDLSEASIRNSASLDGMSILGRVELLGTIFHGSLDFSAFACGPVNAQGAVFHRRTAFHPIVNGSSEVDFSSAKFYGEVVMTDWFVAAAKLPEAEQGPERVVQAKPLPQSWAALGR